MNLFQLVLKQMRQRALSTWLTLLSVILGVALATSVLILRRESAALFTQTDYGYDLLVGAKGSPMQLVLNTIYHIDRSPGNIPYIVLEALRNNSAMVKHAIPYAVGDNYLSFRVAGTTPELFGFGPDGKPQAGWDDKGYLLPGYQPAWLPSDQRDTSKKVAADVFAIRYNRRFTLADGRMFHPKKFEAVVGYDIPGHSGLKIGDKFKVRHDQGGGDKDDEHDEQWTVVGILDRTFTAEDRVLFIPLTSFYAIPKHEQAMDLQTAMQKGEDLSRFGKNKPTTAPVARVTTSPATTQPATAAVKEEHDHHDHDEAYELNPDGTIDLKLPKDRWQLSAVLVRTRGGAANMGLQYVFSNSPMAAAVNPADVMRQFFMTFLSPTTLVLLIISLLVVITAAVSILVSIYNAVSARAREIAIMRALGATRGKILTLICVEAAIVGLIGSALGMLIGHGLGAVESFFFERRLGIGINYGTPSGEEWLYLAGVVVLAILAGLVPGLKAYRTPVATNLVAA